MAVLNLQTGRQKAVQVLGIKELQKNIQAIMSAAVGAEAAAVAADAGRLVFNEMHGKAVSANVPHQVLNDLFIYTRQPSALSGSKSSVTVLVGLRKKGTRKPAQAYRTWFANRQVGAYDKTQRSKRKKQKLTTPGTKIGENLGTMWELGTTKMSARPWFRPAIMASRAGVYAAMAAGYLSILNKRR